MAQLNLPIFERLTVAGPTIIGFFLPFLLAACAGILFHLYNKPVSRPFTTGTNITAIGTTSPTSTISNDLPTTADVASANAAILDYCRNDLRTGTNCTLLANSDITAPGFVESGVRMSGYFEGHSSATDGVALAKGGGSSWSVIWIGQGCIPKNVANSNNVTQPLQVCQ
ncbi:MAG TPA: hypothetical protein VLG92_04515 [Candidatus Saccharimonadia bacterium]|nr:hypothetical protein [Candidatus Saccharimonadia bacterium]